MGDWNKENVATVLREKMTFFGTKGFKRYFLHTGWNIMGRIASLLVAFFVNILVVRSFGPTQYGTVSYVLSYTGLFSSLAYLGLDGVVYVDLIKHPERKNILLGTAFYLKCLGALAAFVCVALSLLFLENTAQLNIYILIVACSFFFQPFNVINLFFQAQVQAKPAVVLTLGINCILSVLKVVCVLAKLDLVYFILLTLVESTLSAAGYVYIYRRYKQSIFQWTKDFEVAKSLLVRSLPLVLSGAFAMLYARVDQVIIKHMMSAHAVGLYDAAVRIAEMWYFVPTAVVGSLLPAVLNAQKHSEDKYILRLTRLYTFALYFSLLFAFPFSFLSDFIIVTLYGEAYAGAADVLRVYVWGGVSFILGAAINNILINENNTKFTLYANFMAMALNVALNIFLIPKYGIIGAAWATCISYTMIPLSTFLFKQTREQGMHILRSIIPR